jgi:outer membrane protein TolC
MIKRILPCIGLLFLGLVPISGLAFGDEVLSWQDCIKEARAQHPDLVSARAKLDQAKANKGIARSTALPQLSASAGLSTGKTQGKDSSKSSSYGVSGRQLLFDGFKTANDLAAAQENIKSSSYNYQIVSSNVLLRLKTAYDGLLTAQKLMDVTQDIVARRQKNMDLVKLRYDAGREHKGAFLTAQANFAQAQFEYEQAGRNLELYQRRLSKELGRSKFVSLAVSGEMDVPQADQDKPDFDVLVDNTPLLKQFVAQKEAARLGVKSARADFLPQIYGDVGAGKTGDTWPPRTGDWSAGISVSFPLFQGGQNQASLARAKAVYEQAQADERSGRDGVIFTLAQAWTAWQDDVAQVMVEEKFLDAAALRSKIAQGEYSTGLIAFNDWTLIEDALVSNQKQILQAKMGALISEANWLQAKGETIDE